MEIVKKCQRSFLELTIYYMRYIQNFSKIIILLTSLTKNVKKFAWDAKCEESFQTLKKCLTISPLLILPHRVDRFVICTDASNLGYRAILIWQGKVIAYASKQLKVHEKNYPAHTLKLGTIVFSFKVRRHYLYRAQFEIFTIIKV